MGNPYVTAGIARAGVFVPKPPMVGNVVNDTSSGIAIGAQAAGYVFIAAGVNTSRVYVLIQNNTTASLSLGMGSPNAQGILLLPGGYYERELYAFTQQIYVTLLAASAAGDYVTVEEGSSQLQD